MGLGLPSGLTPTTCGLFAPATVWGEGFADVFGHFAAESTSSCILRIHDSDAVMQGVQREMWMWTVDR